MAKTKALSHVDDRNRPRMVDVSRKAVSARSAVAECDVCFPAEVAVQLRDQGLRSAKGPIVDTAIIAGVLAAKRTHELIPFCHPLALEKIDIGAEFVDRTTLRIRCTASLSGKTGVEMEALVGATLAALTVYDMTKALSHDIVVGPARLLEKRGGKSDRGSKR